MYAAYQQHNDVVKLLLEHGAEVTAQDVYGELYKTWNIKMTNLIPAAMTLEASMGTLGVGGLVLTTHFFILDLKIK